MALVLLVMPIYYLFTIALPLRNLSAGLFYLCAVAGRIVAAGALRSQRTEALRRALPSFGAALLIGCALQAIDLETGRFLTPQLAKLPFLLEKLVFYFAASFTLEEVAFRGALDPHVYPPGEAGSQAQAWGSALFVSVMWGLWHLPLGEELGVGFWAFLAIALIVEILEGIPLSFCWRQGGTLVLPAIAHAMIDAYRDALVV
jgi:membrane protease YdiL (CAAX protease family)